jgi:hypothetical protein
VRELLAKLMPCFAGVFQISDRSMNASDFYVVGALNYFEEFDGLR